MSRVEDLFTSRVLAALEVQGAAQSRIAEVLSGKPLGTDALIACHLRTARKFELLWTAVAGGLLEKLEADHG